MILFTPAANILPAYVLPGIPAAAILLVTVWSNVFGPPGRMTRLWGSLSMISVAVIVLGLATVAFFLPNTLNVKSERELVLRALEASPDIAITYWADRSYSAEFYAQGRVGYLMDPDGLRALNTNNVRDALAVSSQDIPNLRDQLEAGFVDVGRFGRRHLFIEPSPQ
ncbi:hypothetical protein OEG86_13610 [Hoeflea alexandrii]|uniref:hypothetical protein n=1 Tax=Hoeflea alexandrii TaxID=288436 RepID=UPI002270282F|nr:hypothetical protein [Hoeflea alexandrii]MCY0153107.1 hypothetical protein [Hoeflea alexandrii]